jgi:hypothetical protein
METGKGRDWEEWVKAEKLRVMEVGKYVEELDEWIEDDYCYSEAAAEIVDNLCEELGKQEGMTRLVLEDQWEWDTEWTPESGEWTDKACTLIEQEIAHWQLIGHNYWPDGDIDIQMHLTQYREL